MNTADIEDLPVIYVWMTSQGPLVYAGSDKSDSTVHATTDEALVDVGTAYDGRRILPMSTGLPILPTQSAHITSRPRTACNLKRLVISNAGTAGGAADWVVNDIKIDGVSQFLKPGDISGSLFATNADLDALEALEALVRFMPVQPEMAVDVIVTHVGLNPGGCPFFAAMVGERTSTT